MAKSSAKSATETKPKGILTWVVMGLMAVSMVGFGAAGLSGTVRSIGTVGEKSISTQSYFQALRNQIDLQSARAQRQLSFPEAEQLQIPQQALNALIGQRAIDNEVTNLGISVGDSHVSQQVLANPAFRGIDGAFDQNQYREALARSGMSVNEYEASLREMAARNLVQGAIVGGLVPSETFGQTMAGFARETRNFTWAPLTEDQIELVLDAPSDADLLAHYEANPDLYTSVETRVINYAWLTPAMIQDDVVVDEAELREEYEARIAEFQQPETRLVERLVFAEAALAEAAMTQIETGEASFPDLVAAQGLSLDDIDLGDVSEAALGSAGAAVFAAEPGDVVGPFDTDLGPALFRMNAILAARNISFEQALPDLREDQAAARASRMISSQIEPITNLLAGGATVADLAAQTDMQDGSLEWTRDDTTDIAAYASFRDVALATQVGDYAELHELEDGGIFALEVTEVRAPALIPLEDVRDDVIAGWEQEAKITALRAEADIRAAQLQEAAQDFSALELEAQTEDGMARSAFINGTPPVFMEEVFDMEVEEVRVVPNGDHMIIVRLDGIEAADTEDEGYRATLDRATNAAAEGIAQDIFQIYARTIQLDTDIDINDSAVNAVHSNFR